MSEQTPRAPTPAVKRVDPSYDFYGQTLYPYINMKSTMFTPYITAFKRAIAPINPWALQQIATSESIGYGVKYGEAWYRPQTYPSGIVLSSGFPVHYDPLKNPKNERMPNATPVDGIPKISVQRVPLHCDRQIDTYKRCLIANDDDKQKCQTESQDILAICPPFALDKMRDNRLLRLKLEAQSNIKYRKAMEIPDYNKGRTVADVPLRSWEDGERDNLRPDSMWADERYIDITQKEIDEAKERIKKRNAARGIVPDTKLHTHHYDRTYEAPPTKISLYP